jgi:hypothetical protein
MRNTDAEEVPVVVRDARAEVGVFLSGLVV